MGSAQLIKDAFPMLLLRSKLLRVSEFKELMSNLMSVSYENVDRTLPQMKPLVEVTDDAILLDYTFLVEKILTHKSVLLKKLVQLTLDPKNAVISLFSGLYGVSDDAIFTAILRRLAQLASDPKNAVLSLFYDVRSIGGKFKQDNYRNIENRLFSVLPRGMESARWIWSEYVGSECMSWTIDKSTLGHFKKLLTYPRLLLIITNHSHRKLVIDGFLDMFSLLSVSSHILIVLYN